MVTAFPFSVGGAVTAVLCGAGDTVEGLFHERAAVVGRAVGGGGSDRYRADAERVSSGWRANGVVKGP